MATTPSFGPQNTRQFEAPHERPLISLQERMMRSVREAYDRYKERIPMLRSRDTEVDQLKQEIKLLRQALNEKDSELKRVDMVYQQYIAKNVKKLSARMDALEIKTEKLFQQMERKISIVRAMQHLFEQQYEKLTSQVTVLDPHKNKVFSVIDSSIGTAHKGLTIFSAQSHASHVNTPSYNHVYQPFVNSADLF